MLQPTCCSSHNLQEHQLNEMSSFSRGLKRGQGICQNCKSPYFNRKKPKFCDCGFELGGSFESSASEKSKKQQSLNSVTVFYDNSGWSRSVKVNSKGDRIFAFSQDSQKICYNKHCLNHRATFAVSGKLDEYTCQHFDQVPKESYYSVRFSDTDIELFTPDLAIQNEMKELQSLNGQIPTVVKVSFNCYAAIGRATTSATLQFVHVKLTDDEKCSLVCTGSDCKKKCGKTKQVSGRKICIHIHFTLLARKLKESFDDKSSIDIVKGSKEDSLSVSFLNSLKIQKQRKIPYSIPIDIIKKSNLASYSDQEIEFFYPEESTCTLCSNPLSSPLYPQGCNSIGGNGYLMTNLSPFRKVGIKVRRCTSKPCNALMTAFPYERGLFNGSNKVLIGLDIMIEWREYFKEGVPLTNIIKRKLLALRRQIDEKNQPSEEELEYLIDICYNAFYAFEVMTERNLNDVICGYCGIIGKLYLGDGNEKNCCTLKEVHLDDQVGEQAVDYSQILSNSHDNLENCMDEIKLHLIEKGMYASSRLKYSINIKDVPILIPSKLKQRELNTESEKKSVYIDSATNKLIEGDAILLSKRMRTSNLTIKDIEAMSFEELKNLAEQCKIKTNKKSKDLLKLDVQQLYASIIVGNSACHDFIKSPGHTGGFYHFVCPHGTTVCSKFMILQESVRDPADLWLSLKYPPVLFICDTPCTLVQHINHRSPHDAKEYWGEMDGCFEKPTLDKEPSEGRNVPNIVPEMYQAQSENPVQITLPYCHPSTGEKQRYICGDRFHNTNNPHKSPLCRYHDIDLALQGHTIKTSFQESLNNKKNKKRNKSSCTSGILHHIFYNYLMNFYENEEIIEQQKARLQKAYRKNIRRDYYMRFVFE